jgi:uncharacterized membrane protein YgcG
MADVTVALATSGKDQVVGDLKSVETAGHKMGETFGSISGKLAGLAAGYVTLSTAVGAFNKAMDKGGELADFSEQTGIAVGNLVLLGRAFENNGMKAEDLGKIVNKMQKFIESVGEEGSASANKLAKLGLSFDELKAMSPDKQFEALAKAINGIEDPGERAAMAMEIFGKSGGKLLAFFSDFDGAMKQAKGEVGGFADIMDKNASSFDYLGDGIKAIGEKLMEFAAGALVNIQAPLKVFIDMIKNFDAAGFGEKITKDISGPLEAIADSLVDGNFKQAINMAYELILLGAMKIGNEVVKILQTAFTVVAKFAEGTFSSDGPLIVSIFNGFLDAGKFIGEVFKAAFMEAGSAAHAWLKIALAAMRMDLPGVIAGFEELKEVHNMFGETSKKTAKTWGEIASNAMEAGKEVYNTADGFFDVADQQDKVKTMSEKIVGDHKALSELTDEIGDNLEDWMYPEAPDWWQEGPPTDLFADMMSPDWWNENNLSNQTAPSWWDDLGLDSGGGGGDSGGGGGDSGGGGGVGGGGGKSDISSTLKEILKCLKGDIAPALPVQVMS